MCKTPYGFGKVQGQQLCNLQRQLEEIYQEEEGEEELNLSMPPGPPLNRITTIEDRVSALEDQLKSVDAKVDQLGVMLRQVGDMVHYMWCIVRKAEKNADDKPRLYVPGGN